MFVGEGDQAEVVWECINVFDENLEIIADRTAEILRQGKLAEKKKKKVHSVREPQVKYLTRSRLRMPEESAKNKKIFYCPNKCGSSFLYQHSLDKHVRHICDKPTSYKCPYCSVVSRNRNSINVHITFCHPGYKNYVIDTFIGKSEPIFNEDEGDTSYEQQIKPSWNEEHEIKILSVSSLAKPEDIKHEFEGFRDESDTKSFPCPNNCGNSYEHEYTLKAHVECTCHQNQAPNNLHPDEEKLESGTFDMTMMEVTKFDIPEELPNPMALGESPERRTKEGRWICPKRCGGTFSTRSNMNYHLRTLCGVERLLECPYCSHRMKQSANGFTHIKNHHPGARLCLLDTETGEIIRRKKDINTEMANIDDSPPEVSESGEISPLKPSKTCHSCGKVFKALHTLSRHLAEGCGQPPRFKCPWCDYQVRRLTYAFTHVTKSHPGSKVYMVDLITGESITDSTQIKKEALEQIEEDKPLASNPVHSLRPKRVQNSVPAGLQKKKLMCPQGCGQHFFFTPNLQKHVKYNCRKAKHSKSTGLARFKCSYCPNVFVHRTSLVRHIKSHHRGKIVVVIDTHAEKMVPENDTAKKLERSQEKKTQKVKTNKLSKASDNKNATEKTEDNSNSQETPELIHCPDKSGSMLEHNLNIGRPLRKPGTNVRRFKCPQCSYCSQKFSLVGKHIKKSHRKSKIHVLDLLTKQIVYSEPKRRPRALKPLRKGVQEPAVSSEAEGEQKLDSLVPETSAEKTKVQNRYPCPNRCGKTFQLERSIETHLRMVCGRSCRFKCPYCSKVCRNQGNVALHIRHLHPGRKSYTIDILKKKTPRERGKKPKAVKKTKEIQEEVDKEQLPIVTGSNDMDSQMVITNEETSETVSEPLIMDVSARKKAKKLSPIIKRRVECPNKCGRGFTSAQRLKVHIKSNCKCAPTFKCPHCEVVFKRSWNFDMHIKQRHPQFCDASQQQDAEARENQKNDLDLRTQNGASEELINSTGEIEGEEHELDQLEQRTNLEVTNDIEDDVEMGENGTEVIDNDDANEMEITNDVVNPDVKNDEEEDIEFNLEDENDIEQETSHVVESNTTASVSSNTSNCGSMDLPATEAAEDHENRNVGQNDLVENQNAPVNQELIGVAQMEAMDNDLNVESNEADEPIVEDKEELGAGSQKSSSEEKPPFICPNNCDSSFSHENSLSRHIEDQCGPHRFKCPHCFYITRKPSMVYTHIKNKHPDERIYMIDTDMNQSYDEPGSPLGDDGNP